jgi:acetoacetyl-CoA synthetase
VAEDEQTGTGGTSTRGVAEGTTLWEPSARRIQQAAVTRFQEWLAAERGLRLRGADELWRWSTTDLDGFWNAVWDFCAVDGDRGDGPALADARMPGAVWFPGARLNYAENALSRRGAAPALIAIREDAATAVVSWDGLRRQVAKAAAGLRGLGVEPGDRVCAVLPNTVYSVVAMLATAAVGAVWSSCSPDFGPTGLADRFAQISPKVLIGVDGYSYGGRPYGTLDALARVAARIPELRATVIVPYLAADALDRADAAGLPGLLSWDEMMASDVEEPDFVRLPFDAPLWILYSSGTTGLPKPIVHGHGGILLEHLKSLALHLDLGPDDRFCWFTTTGWMMWNYLVSGLLVGATTVLYDGSPGFPDLGTLWRLVEAVELTCLGTSAAFLTSCAAADVEPRALADLSTLRTLGSTGSPLSPDGFAWVYDHVGSDIMLSSISGGTDICTALAAGLPTLPVRAGEIGMRALGCAVAAFDETGTEVVDQVGELVVTRPMPSMPLSFWADEDGSRLRDSYFATYPGVWRHGDWVRITPDGALVMHGRSDATLKRGGVRIGTAEIYNVVEQLPGISDSIVVDTGTATAAGELVLFVVPTTPGLTDDLVTRIRAVIREQISPRHVPDRVIEIPEVPRTHNGKKLEVPVKQLLAGTPLEKAVSLAAVANPESLLPFVHAS